ncbi:hypothetical protein Scep_012372 [Stephania cephalantha]|uniref:Uncharacterized protein n=1 Tax=Stephania cephalantha TaxID=152367 RepID=A0AAP0JF12_9MAGN
MILCQQTYFSDYEESYDKLMGIKGNDEKRSTLDLSRDPTSKVIKWWKIKEMSYK